MNASIFLHAFTFNAFQEKTYVVFNACNECILIDPGCESESEREQLAHFLAERKLEVKHLVNTHAHLDHVWGNRYVASTYGVPAAMHAEGLPLLEQVPHYAKIHGIEGYEPIQPERFLVEGSCIAIAHGSFRVLYVPGHAPGHIALYSEPLKICFVGDTLFRGSIGRTDLWGGDGNLLVESIRTQLFSLPDDVVVYPGHGEPTTIGREKQHNPYVALRQNRTER